MTDFRVQYWLAATDNIREADKYTLDQPEKWAFLLCAIGNATMAALPDSVMEGVMVESARRQATAKQTQKKVQKKIKGDLNGK